MKPILLAAHTVNGEVSNTTCASPLVIMVLPEEEILLRTHCDELLPDGRDVPVVLERLVFPVHAEMIAGST